MQKCTEFKKYLQILIIFLKICNLALGMQINLVPLSLINFCFIIDEKWVLYDNSKRKKSDWPWL